MIKAVFFDIDGTLVSFKTHQMPDSALKALQQLKANGIHCFIATGRGKGGLEVVSRFPFDGYITLNGQYDYTPEKVIYENFIPRKDIHILMEELKKHPFPCGFQMEEKKVFNYRDERVDEIHAITRNDDQPAGDVSDVENHKVYQAMAFISKEEEKELMQKLTGCTSARWHPYFTDISPLGGTKVIGMDLFARYYGFTMEETMAVGDGGNDIQMLKHAGTSIAMGNGEEEVKAIADYVTDDVDHDGLMKAMEHYHLL
jgi:Cof subfamily protein (haloacid dehalogenase superfamily)